MCDKTTPSVCGVACGSACTFVTGFHKRVHREALWSSSHSRELKLPRRDWRRHYSLLKQRGRSPAVKTIHWMSCGAKDLKEMWKTEWKMWWKNESWHRRSRMWWNSGFCFPTLLRNIVREREKTHKIKSDQECSSEDEHSWEVHLRENTPPPWPLFTQRLWRESWQAASLLAPVAAVWLTGRLCSVCREWLRLTPFLWDRFYKMQGEMPQYGERSLWPLSWAV